MDLYVKYLRQTTINSLVSNRIHRRNIIEARSTCKQAMDSYTESNMSMVTCDNQQMNPSPVNTAVETTYNSNL